MAFIMVPSLNTNGAFPRQYLGLLNATNQGNASDHLFAVEFDTVQNLEFNDLDDNHVGINLNSLTSINSSTAGYWTSQTTKVNLSLKSGQNMQAWIQYDNLDKQLNVTIAPIGYPQPVKPLLSVHLDLSTVLEDYMYVGFSAATGLLSGVHRVLSWSFNSNGVAQSLDLSKLPYIMPPSSHSLFNQIILGSCIALLVILLAGAVTAAIWRKRSQREEVEDWELEFGQLRYAYKELSIATQGFHDNEILGTGGFGRVYKGVLPSSGLEVAVKRLSRTSDQGEREFIAEMCSVGRLRHRNLVQLLGWSRRKGELLLVYEYMTNGSLYKILFGKKSAILLGWEERFKILSGVAAGMLYLHEGWEQRVLHRDVKASNVLLDAKMNAKLGDFGLARLYEHGQNPDTTRVVGTLGYLAPEFTKTGKATASTDVFSYGALVLEVATGRRPLEHHNADDFFILQEHVWNLYTEGRLLDAADPRLGGCFNKEEMGRVLALGLWCSHPNPSSRPSMRQVVHVLANDASLPPLPPFDTPFQYPSSKIYSECSSFISSAQRTWSTADAASTEVSAR